MKVLSEKDNLFEFEFSNYEVEALLSFAVNRILKDKIEEMKEKEETDNG